MQNYKIIRPSEIANEAREQGAYSIKRLGTFLMGKPENIGLYQTTIPPRSKVSRHKHQTLEEYLIFMTEGKMEIEGHNYSLNPGDVVYLPNGTSHEICAEESEVRLIAIKLPDNKEDKVKT